MEKIRRMFSMRRISSAEMKNFTSVGPDFCFPETSKTI